MVEGALLQLEAAAAEAAPGQGSLAEAPPERLAGWKGPLPDELRAAIAALAATAQTSKK